MVVIKDDCLTWLSPLGYDCWTNTDMKVTGCVLFMYIDMKVTFSALDMKVATCSFLSNNLYLVTASYVCQLEYTLYSIHI
jgi:hypothetical protein